ncbi:MAG: ATP-binding protein [Pelagimonas sp.]|jgi:CheY-like chemotaxis protein/nitrogen-specific signal transduction histidine kinase|nr:ATP-binding protein [Pelagimonas sp.]
MAQGPNPISHLELPVDCDPDSCRLVNALDRALTQNLTVLQNQASLFGEILENVGEGMIVLSHKDPADPENEIVLANKAYMELYGITSEHVYPGQKVSDFLEGLQRMGKMAQPKKDRAEIDATGSGKDRTVMEIPSMGKVFHCKASDSPSGGRILIHTDVTDLYTQNDALRSARDAAKVASETKSNFLATMSHEIRTPMNGVVGMAELLGATPLDDTQRAYVELISSSALTLTNLISDILDFSKIEAGRLEFDYQPVEIKKVLRDVFGLLTPLATGKGLELISDLDPELPSHIHSDAVRFKQILFNLLGNAIKFTTKGTVTLVIRKRQDLKIWITDTGIGIPPDKLPHVFQPFEQAHGGKNRDFEGTGLGLAITKQILNAMDGCIQVRSTEGVGTEFEITLPLSPAQIEISPDALDPSETGGAEHLTGKSALLVEDNRTNQIVLSRMLESRGMTVTIAGNGQEAVDLFAPGKFDVVFMDISMPVMTGIEAVRVIRSNQHAKGWPHCPIIALTGNAFERDKKEALAAGMDAFMTKPVRGVELVATLRSVFTTTA